jgi:hypothetical protein
MRLRDWLTHKAVMDSADFAEQYLDTAVVFDDIDPIQRFAVELAPKEGRLIELGVSVGASITALSGYLMERGDKRTIYGFDSWAGLDEDWVGHMYTKGHFARTAQEVAAIKNNMPPNVQLIDGLIADTLPGFVDQPIALLHIDTDTYTPAKQALEICGPYLQPGSIVMLDDFFCYPNWRNHEWKALRESGLKFTFRAFGHYQAVVQIGTEGTS